MTTVKNAENIRKRQKKKKPENWAPRLQEKGLLDEPQLWSDGWHQQQKTTRGWEGRVPLSNMNIEENWKVEKMFQENSWYFSSNGSDLIGELESWKRSLMMDVTSGLEHPQIFFFWRTSLKGKQEQKNSEPREAAKGKRITRMHLQLH